MTFASESEAVTVQKLLNANDQSFTVAHEALAAHTVRVPTVTEVVQEHLDHLVRPSSGTIRTYRSMLEHHIAPLIGTIEVGALDVRRLTQWVRAMHAKGNSAKTIHNVHGLVFSAMEFAIRAGDRLDNPCRGMRLPVGEKIGDDAQFLTPAEFALVLDGIPGEFKVFVPFLVVTGTRFGEATAVTIDDLELDSHPATVRITKAWKRDGNNAYYVGPTKTGAGKRTVSLPPTLVEMLAPLTAGRRGNELVFTSVPAPSSPSSQSLPQAPPSRAPQPPAHPRQSSRISLIRVTPLTVQSPQMARLYKVGVEWTCWLAIRGTFSCTHISALGAV